MKESAATTARGRAPAGILLSVLATLALGGCLFEPRTPEAPSSGESISYLQQTEAKNAWANLQTSLNNSDSYGWERNIHEDFRYVPDQEAETQFPGLFDDWNFEKEKNFINRFFDSGVEIQAEMRDDDFVVPDASGLTEVEWIGVIYFLDVKTLSDGSRTRYRASARITFRLDGTSWYIYEWVDQQGQSDPDNESQLLPSLGVLRGSFGSK